MNFLAHCTLAEDAARDFQADVDLKTGLIAGGLIGDFVKGPVPADWPEPLQAGVRLHRKIDAISNQDPAIRKLSASYPKALRRFAPIFLDLVADHSLAKNWSDHYAQDRKLFCQDCYAAISAYEEYLPKHGARFFQYIREVDLLTNYHQWRHVQRGTESVLRRLDRTDLRESTDAAMLASLKPTDDELHGIFMRLRAGWLDWDPFL